MSKTGKVAKFIAGRGYGFIFQDDGGEDLFVHARDLADGQSLVDGDVVRYDEGYDDRKGKTHAINVTGGTGGEEGGGGKGFGGGGGGFGGGGKGFREGGKGFGGGKGYGGDGKGYGGFGGGGKGKGKSKDKGPSVVVKGLAFEATEEDLRAIFSSCGEYGPRNVKVVTDRETGRSRGLAFVDFDDYQAVDQALLLTDTELMGRRFFVDHAR